MKIIGEIEANSIPKIGKTVRDMKLSLMGSEVVIIVIPAKEMEWMKQDFYRVVKQRQLMWKDRASLEKSELFHMIGIALRNAKKSTCTWFREAAIKIDQDAQEFDQLLVAADEVRHAYAPTGQRSGLYILISRPRDWIWRVRSMCRMALR